MWSIAVAAGLGYLLGSVPTGYIVARLAKGIDIRAHGSGNPGATNVFRVVGKRAGVTVLVIDLLKGMAAVAIATPLVTLLGPASPAWAATLAGLGALMGHSRSVWLGFTGGKSAATGLGVLLALSWPVGGAVAAIFAVAFALTRIVSVGSLAAAVATPVLMVLLGYPFPYQLLAIAGSVYVIVRHRSNIARLMAGTEPRLAAAEAIAADQTSASDPLP